MIRFRFPNRRVTALAGVASAGLALAILPGVSGLPATASAPGAAGSATDHGHWVASWVASPQAAGPANPTGAAGFNDQTVRNIVFTAVGGTMVRVRVSNTFGAAPLVIGHAAIGITGLDAGVIPGTAHSLTFGGKQSVTVPVGGERMSDPAPLAVRPLQDLSVSLFLPDATGAATTHSTAMQNNYISGPGDFALQSSGKAFTTISTSWFFIDGVDVLAPKHVVGTVVAVGDSITDGNASGLNANGRWPNWLARRLDAVSGPTLASVDAGIAGNRMTLDSPCFGVNALAREDRDVLDQTGVRAIILFEGINDIQFPLLASESFPPPSPIHVCFTPAAPVSAAQIIAADQQFIARAHARGIKVFGATLTPLQGSLVYSSGIEAERQAVNAWIRTSHAFDGVFDFDKAVRDPYDPHFIDPTYAGANDNIHMNDIGYKALADAINLRALLGR